MKPPDKRLKILRSTIMATAAKERGWDYDTIHDMMDSWGFGRSLKKLSLGELTDILRIIRGDAPPHREYGIGTLDAQGLYMWNLMKDAGWTFPRLRQWMLIHCKASHWNALEDSEKRAIIAMLKKYIVGADLRVCPPNTQPALPPLSLDGRGDGGEGENNNTTTI